MDAGQFIADRTALGMSQRGIAKALGVDSGTISRWESGESRIPHAIELALATLRRRMVMETRFTTRADVNAWVADRFPDLTVEQAKRAGGAMWMSDEFPHPVNNTSVDDYLATITEEWIYQQAGIE